MADDGETVKGGMEMLKQAEAGMQLFKQEGPAATDLPAAEAFKAQHEASMAEMQKGIDSLTGKDNKKERTTKSKELSEFKVQKQYIDACKVVKGLEPPNGFFLVKSAEPAKVEAPAVVAEEPAADDNKPDAEAKKAAKPAKKTESAGLSPAEKKELDQLKSDIIARKTQLKGEGMSGGQQNKDSQIVEWVNRMNELKEKESPGSTAKSDKKDEGKKNKKLLSADVQKQTEELKKEIEDYKNKLRTEFGYSNKDIKADPELKEMEAKLTALEK